MFSRAIFISKHFYMAKSDSILGNVSGKVGNLVFYRMRGSDTMIVRRKGSISKYARKNHRRFEKTRMENSEFKGCVKAAKEMARVLAPINALGDFNSFGLLVKIAKMIQQQDTESPRGKRSVLISRSPALLTGFSFNRYNTFESLVKSPISFSIEREGGTGNVVIPAMLPGIHLVNHLQQPYYRFVCTLGRICDLHISESGRDYETLHKEYLYSDVQFSPWINWKEPMPETTLTLQAPRWTNEPHNTLVAGIGIDFGREKVNGSIESTRYAGAGKVWLAI
jgi:hypothetical protein